MRLAFCFLLLCSISCATLYKDPCTVPPKDVYGAEKAMCMHVQTGEFCCAYGTVETDKSGRPVAQCAYILCRKDCDDTFRISAGVCDVISQEPPVKIKES